MNNYLASIVARTLDFDPPVRPRLAGRFDPARVVFEPSLESRESIHPATSNPSEWDSDRDWLHPLEPMNRRDSDRQPAELVDPALPGYRSAATTREMNRPAASPVPDNVTEASPSLTIPAPGRPAVEPPRQTVNVEVRQAKEVDVAEGVGLWSSPPHAPREESTAGPLVPKDSAGSAHLHHAVPDEDVVATLPVPYPKSKNHPSAGDDEGKILAPQSNQQKADIERDRQSISIREKPEAHEAERPGRSDAPSRPPSVVSSPEVGQRNNSKAEPVFIQSRIAPRIEVAPDLMALKRSGIEPQPTVHVTIGRLEVRAVQTSEPSAKPRAAAPVMNLDDYLKRRSQGGTR